VRVLIIDDESSDNTSEVGRSLMTKDPRVLYVRHQANIGHIATYNEGLEWASADYLLLLSADDILLPGALRRAVAVMDKNPEVGMTFGRVLYFPDGFAVSRLSEENIALCPSPFQKTAAIINDSSETRSFAETHRGWSPRHGSPFAEGRLIANDLDYSILKAAEFMKSSRHSNQVHTATAIVRTAVQKSIGGYRKELPHAGDMEMWFRFAVHAPIAYINSFQAAARVHQRNMSSEYYEKPIFDLQQRKLLLDIIFNGYSDLIEDHKKVSVQMYRGLSEACVRAAGVPFSMGDTAACDEMLDFAQQIYGPIRHSILWKCFAIKRICGPRLWSMTGSVLRPLAERVFRFGF
jgi:glycosyltransferase involved in cell wall biosynthesis